MKFIIRNIRNILIISSTVIISTALISFRSNNTPKGPYLSIKKYGALPNTNTDETAAIQAAIDAALKGNIKTVYFPPGKYMIRTVNIGAGLTLWGYGVTMQLAPRQAKFTRMFDTANKNYTYNSNIDSKPLIIKGFTFDGNRLNQGPYRNYELEHQAMIFLTAGQAGKGHLVVFIQDTHFNDGAADGLAVYHNIKGTFKNITAKDVFRGGVQLGGGNNIIDIDGYISTGDEENTGLHSEPGSHTAGPNIITVSNINLQKNFTISLVDSSRFIGKNITAGSPWSVSALAGSTVLISDSRLGGGKATKQSSNILHPNNVQFVNVDFYADDLTTAPKNGKQYAVRVMMNNQWSSFKDQQIKFIDCRIHLPKSGKPVWKIGAFYEPGNQKAMNNVFALKNIKYDTGFDFMQYPNAAYIINDTN